MRDLILRFLRWAFHWMLAEPEPTDSQEVVFHGNDDVTEKVQTHADDTVRRWIRAGHRGVPGDAEGRSDPPPAP